MITRRELINLAAAATLVRALPAFAQQSQVKRLAFLFTLAEDDPHTAAFLQSLRVGLASEGWVEGHNLHMDHWYSIDTPARSLDAGRAALLLRPDVILATTYVTFADPASAVPGGTSVPVVFTLGNPAALGLIKSYAHREGNLTGFTTKDDSVTGKLVELLAEVAPNLTRAGYVNDPSGATFAPTYEFFAAAAKAKGIEPIPIPITDAAEIVPALEAFAAHAGGGVVVAGILAIANRSLVVPAIDRLRLPAVYAADDFNDLGGLVVYANDPYELMQSAAEYAGQVLRGTKIADLQVQTPIHYRLTVNLKTAKEQGLTIPQTLLAQADEING